MKKNTIIIIVVVVISLLCIAFGIIALNKNHIIDKKNSDTKKSNGAFDNPFYICEKEIPEEFPITDRRYIVYHKDTEDIILYRGIIITKYFSEESYQFAISGYQYTKQEYFEGSNKTIATIEDYISNPKDANSYMSIYNGLIQSGYKCFEGTDEDLKNDEFVLKK